MNKNMRKFITISIVVLSLMVLSSCQWLREKLGGCASCPVPPAPVGELTGQSLLTVKGRDAITVDSFEDFWNFYTENNAQAKMIAEFYPNIRQEMFKNTLVPLELAYAWAHETGKLRSTEIQRKLKKQCEFFERGLALDLLREEILNSIDKNDDALSKFFEENKEKIAIFQQPQFLKVPAGTKADAVEFNNEKAAKDFLEKAKKPGANFSNLARDAKLTAKDLGMVTSESKDVDSSVRMKLSQMKQGDVDLVEGADNKFYIVKATAKKDGQYLSFDEIKKQPELKDAIERTLTNVKGTELFTKKIEDLKKQFDVKENIEFFEKESKRKQDELQEKLKEYQKQDDSGAKPAKEQQE